MSVHLLTAAPLLSFAGSPDARGALSMVVSPEQPFGPTNLTIRGHVEPHVGNRALAVIAELGAYYRSSPTPIDGSEAPRTITVEIRNAPGGDDGVRGFLINSASTERAVVHAHVLVHRLGRQGVAP